MSETIENLPDVGQFEALSFDPQSNMISLQYKPAHKPNTLCRVKFSLESSDRLTGWLVEMLEKLTGDAEHGRRLKALEFRGQEPKGRA